MSTPAPAAAAAAQPFQKLLPYLNLAVQKNASDIFFTANAPAMLKVEGEMLPVGKQQLAAEFIRDLALSAGALIAMARFANGVPGERVQVEKVEPREWKGTVDKKIMLARIYDKLSAEELSVIKLETKKLQQGIRSGRGPGADVLDAIGVGLWKLGRLGKGRIR